MFNFTRYQLVAACIIVAAALVGTVVLVAKSGVFGAIGGGEIKFIEAGAGAGEAGEQSRTICVHVAGKVKKPGVYNLQPGSRVIDALAAAGGSTADADLENISLAEKLTDGQQVYIAVRGEVPPPKRSVVRGGSAPEATRPSIDESSENHRPEKLTTPGQGTVNINTAGIEELQRLPGIGPGMARRIIAYRNEHGRYQSVEEMDEVEGIGLGKLDELRPFVSL